MASPSVLSISPETILGTQNDPRQLTLPNTIVVSFSTSFPHYDLQVPLPSGGFVLNQQACTPGKRCGTLPPPRKEVTVSSVRRVACRGKWLRPPLGILRISVGTHCDYPGGECAVVSGMKWQCYPGGCACAPREESWRGNAHPPLHVLRLRTPSNCLTSVCDSLRTFACPIRCSLCNNFPSFLDSFFWVTFRSHSNPRLGGRAPRFRAGR